jgi:hypothetical protein
VKYAKTNNDERAATTVSTQSLSFDMYCVLHHFRLMWMCSSCTKQLNSSSFEQFM